MPDEHNSIAAPSSMSSRRSRQHLTIADKNRLRRHHKQHPELTQEQLRAWAYDTFGQWVARSTVGHIVRGAEEVCANPQATRFQSGRYPDMEQELYAWLEARGLQLGVDIRRLDGGTSTSSISNTLLNDSQLWTKANEILKRTRGSNESVSAAWVHRFKKRHGLHPSQLKRAAVNVGSSAAAATTVVAGGAMQEQTVVEQQIEEEEVARVSGVGGKRRSGDGDVDAEQEEAGETTQPSRKRPATAATETIATAAAGSRSHFVSSDDILLLTQALTVKPWGFPCSVDGWQQVSEWLKTEDSFRLDKTAGACQARLNLLLSHLKSGNMAALRKSGTEEEFDRKCALLAEVAMQIETHAQTQKELDTATTAVAEVAMVADPATGTAQVAVLNANVGMPGLAQERERMAQRRLELMERKMERELAAQKRHSEEQVSRLEKLHREQQQVQQEQHAQLLATIQQQQAMMLDLIKTLAPASNMIEEPQP